MWENTEHPADQIEDDGLDSAGYSDWVTDLAFIGTMVLCCVVLGYIVRQLLA